MGKADRISVDISELRSQIEGYARTKIWRRLPLAQKVLTLLEEALGVKAEKRILREFFYDLAHGNPMDRHEPNLIADILETEVDYVQRLIDGYHAGHSEHCEHDGGGVCH